MREREKPARNGHDGHRRLQSEREAEGAIRRHSVCGAERRDDGRLGDTDSARRRRKQPCERHHRNDDERSGGGSRHLEGAKQAALEAAGLMAAE